MMVTEEEKLGDSMHNTYMDGEWKFVEWQEDLELKICRSFISIIFVVQAPWHS